MAATDPHSTPTLVCKECEYANEPERVYCHNCGAKLDRSVLPKEEQLRRESPDKARKRIIKMTNPGTSVIKREILALLKTLACAVLVAGAIQAARPPDGVNAQGGDSGSLILSNELTNLTGSPGPHSQSFTEGDLNNVLKSKLSSTGKSFIAEYKRTFVTLEEGAARLTTEKSIYGWSFYIGTHYRVEGHDGVLASSNLGGTIGRLPIHPLIMDRASGFLFNPVFASVKREWEMVAKMQSVLLHPGHVDLVSAGKGAAAR